MARQRSDEGKVNADIALAFGHGPCRLLRNNVGMLRDRTGRPVAYGLGSMGKTVLRGPSDWIGWRTLTITPEMVGQRIAVFAAVEVKDKGKPTEEQLAFINIVQDAGGLAGVARSVPDALSILRM